MTTPVVIQTPVLGLSTEPTVCPEYEFDSPKENVEVIATYEPSDEKQINKLSAPLHSEKTELKRPSIILKKGKTSQGVYYIRIKLKKYSGKYINIYVKTKRKNDRVFKKIKLKNNEIKSNKSGFKLKYNGKKTTIYVKVKTYVIKNNKKVYSKFSPVKSVKIR